MSIFQVGMTKGTSWEIPKIIMPWKPERRWEVSRMKKATIPNGELKVSVVGLYKSEMKELISSCLERFTSKFL